MQRVPIYTSLSRIVATVAAIEALTIATGLLGHYLTKRLIDAAINYQPPPCTKEHA